jgi:hypothetical protein
VAAVTLLEDTVVALCATKSNDEMIKASHIARAENMKYEGGTIP